MKKINIGKEEFITVVSIIIALVSLAITVYTVINKPESKWQYAIIVILSFILLSTIIISFHITKTHILKRALSNIFSNKLSLITTTQYTYYASRNKSGNPKVKLDEEILEVSLINKDKLNNPNIKSYDPSCIQSYRYYIDGQYQKKKPLTSLTAIFTKDISEDFSEVTYNPSNNITVTPFESTDRNFSGTNYRPYRIDFLNRIDKDNSQVNFKLEILYDKPMLMTGKHTFFMDPSNFSHKTNKLIMDIVTNSDYLLDESKIAIYKLNKSTLSLKEFNTYKVTELTRTSINDTTFKYRFDFRQETNNKRISNNFIYILQIKA